MTGPGGLLLADGGEAGSHQLLLHQVRARPEPGRGGCCGKAVVLKAGPVPGSGPVNYTVGILGIRPQSG